MRILILGGTGMLGHTLWSRLSSRFSDTFTTIRGYSEDRIKSGLFRNKEQVIENIDAFDFSSVQSVLERICPEIILNCTGITKRREEANDIIASITLNSLFPHKLAAWGKVHKAKVIQFSTDCVFDGTTGNYTEESQTSAEDVYGKTKALGELKTGDTLTLRSSFIGPELSHGSELLEWFLSQSGKAVKGFRKAVYSGLTTFELCRVVEMLLVHYPRAKGLYNVSSDPITKYDLLLLIKKKIGLDIDIIPDDGFSCDRSLNSAKFRTEFKYIPPSWETMIDDLSVELKRRRQ